MCRVDGNKHRHEGRSGKSLISRVRVTCLRGVSCDFLVASDLGAWSQADPTERRPAGNAFFIMQGFWNYREEISILDDGGGEG